MIKVQGIDLRIRTLSFRLVAYVEARVPILENDMNKMMDNEMGAVCVYIYIWVCMQFTIFTYDFEVYLRNYKCWVLPPPK